MAKFRKKPVVIEAIQFTGGNGKELEEFAGKALKYNGEEDDFTVFTLEGFKPLPEGYWIIKGIKGEFYPCAPDIFEATYEPA